MEEQLIDINTEETGVKTPTETEKEGETLDFNYSTATDEHQSIIKVVGVGGGGSNAVKNMYREGIENVTYLLVNTDKGALNDTDITAKLQISKRGLGAGGNPDKGEDYATQYEESIRSALNDGTEMVFITAGMGGGTGTGAGPVVARVARELGILTIGIVTIPFEFEGVRKINTALRGVAKMRKNVDALLVVNNSRLSQLFPGMSFYEAFKKADDTLTTAAKSISDIINKTGYINLDFEDVKHTLENSGVALISTGEASGEARMKNAIEEAINSPLLQDNKIDYAERLLFEVCFSESNPMNMNEVQYLNEFVGSLNPDIDVIWGALTDNSLGDNIRFIVLAAGFKMDDVVKSPAKPAGKPTESMNDDKEEVGNETTEVAEAEPAAEPQREEAPIAGPDTKTETATDAEAEAGTNADVDAGTDTEADVETGTEKVAAETPESVATGKVTEVHPADNPEDAINEIRRYYGAEKAEEAQMEEIRKRYYLLDDKDLTNEKLVEMLEHMPSYNRSAEQLGELKKVAQQRNEASASPQHTDNIF